MSADDLFDRLVNEAWNHDFSGWDFTYLSNRMVEEQPSWSYRQLVLEKIKTVDSLLDQDTGGGEFLSSLHPLPKNTYATEGYQPNVNIARDRLEPLGVQVFDTLATVPQPFPDNSFDLVINRHGGFSGSEINRILKPGKSFVTQQVGGKNNLGLNAMLQDLIKFQYAYWTLSCAIEQLQACGLEIVDRREDYPRTEFRDIGAVVYHLKVISWQVGDFTVEKYYDRLRKIHEIIQQTGKFVTTSHRFYIEARKKL